MGTYNVYFREVIADCRPKGGKFESQLWRNFVEIDHK